MSLPAEFHSKDTRYYPEKQIVSHLADVAEVDCKRDLERAVINNYGIVRIVGDVGKKAVELQGKKYYEGGMTANLDWHNEPSDKVLENQPIFFVISFLLPGCILSRNDLREYSHSVDGDVLVLTHARSEVK